MAKNFIQPGEVITVTAPAAVTSGSPLLVGTLFGVAQTDAESGAYVEIVRRGVYVLPKVLAQAWTAGAKIYWDDTAKNCTSTASGNTLIGAAVAAAANPSESGQVLLDGVIR